MTYYTWEKNSRGKTLHDVLHEGLMCRAARFQHFTLLHKFGHSCRVSERREGKRERQVWLSLVLLIKFVLLLIIFQISFSLNLLVANWRLSPEFLVAKIFFHSPWRLKWSQLGALSMVASPRHVHVQTSMLVFVFQISNKFQFQTAFEQRKYKIHCLISNHKGLGTCL